MGWPRAARKTRRGHPVRIEGRPLTADDLSKDQAAQIGARIRKAMVYVGSLCEDIDPPNAIGVNSHEIVS